MKYAFGSSALPWIKTRSWERDWRGIGAGRLISQGPCGTNAKNPASVRRPRGHGVSMCASVSDGYHALVHIGRNVVGVFRVRMECREEFGQGILFASGDGEIG